MLLQHDFNSNITKFHWVLEKKKKYRMSSSSPFLRVKHRELQSRETSAGRPRILPETVQHDLSAAEERNWWWKAPERVSFRGKHPTMRAKQCSVLSHRRCIHFLTLYRITRSLPKDVTKQRQTCNTLRQPISCSRDTSTFCEPFTGRVPGFSLSPSLSIRSRKRDAYLGNIQRGEKAAFSMRPKTTLRSKQKGVPRATR